MNSLTDKFQDDRRTYFWEVESLVELSLLYPDMLLHGFPWWLSSKESACSAGD